MSSQAGSLRHHARVAALVAAAVPLSCASPSPPPHGVDTSAGWIGPGDRAPPPGDRPGRPTAPASSVASPERPTAPTPWELTPTLSTFAVALPRGHSQHFAGELEADVRINSAAAGYPALARDRAFPAGAALLASHYPPGAPTPVVLLAMVKHPPGYDPDAGDWEYLILTPTGDATHRGRLPLCKRCHAEAPHDHLFGGPR